MKPTKVLVYIERSVQVAPYKFFKQGMYAEAVLEPGDNILTARKELEEVVVNEVRKMGNNEIKRYELEQNES